MIARQTLNIYIQYLKNLPRLHGYSLVIIIAAMNLLASVLLTSTLLSVSDPMYIWEKHILPHLNMI